MVALKCGHLICQHMLFLPLHDMFSRMLNFTSNKNVLHTEIVALK